MKLSRSAGGTDQAAHETGAVRLSDGRVARVRAANPAADRRTDLLLLQARFVKGGHLDPLMGARARVVFSITEIDGDPVPWPPCRPTHDAVQAYLNSFTREDVEALAAAYDKANPGAVTQILRPGRRGAPRGRMLGARREEVTP